jgi:multiple sugar transport system permease protein
MGYGAAIAVVLFAHHDGLHLGLHLEDVARRDGALRCSPVRSSSSRPARSLYTIALPIALFLWLLPLLGVALTSVRPGVRPRAGQLLRHALGIAFENYVFIFTTPIGVHAQLLVGHDPHGDRRGGSLSLMTGFALAVYGFRANLLVFFMFVAGNFVPFQILMVPVRDMTLQLGMYNTWYTGLILFHIAFQTGFCTLFMRNFIKALPFELIEAARVEGVAEWRIFWYIVLPLMRPAIAALSVLVFTFIWNDFFWATVLTTAREPAHHRGPVLAQRPVDRAMAPRLGRIDPRRPAARRDVLPDAEALHRGPHARSRQVTIRIAFIGAGSTVFMKNIVGDALHFPALAGTPPSR